MLNSTWQTKGFKLYAETVPESVKKFGGKYLVRAGEFKSMQENGNSQKCNYSISNLWKSVRMVQLWPIQTIKRIAPKGSEGNIIIIKGI